MSGIKCFVCQCVFKDLERFDTQDDWTDQPHENILECVKSLSDKIVELTEAISLFEERFAYDRQARRKQIV